jgi:hypothetical protein
LGIKSDKPDDYRHSPAFAVVEDVIEQGRLPGTEKSGWNAFKIAELQMQRQNVATRV